MWSGGRGYRPQRGAPSARRMMKGAPKDAPVMARRVHALAAMCVGDANRARGWEAEVRGDRRNAESSTGDSVSDEADFSPTLLV
jgi:hypothetical protein